MRLSPVREADYVDFAQRQVVDCAEQLVRSGEASESESLALAREQLRPLLDDELRPAGHIFLVAHSALVKPRIGWVWISPAPEFLGPLGGQARWLSQLTVEERGRGWGRALLNATERHLTRLGVKQLWLRVFDWNTSARALYDAQGYELVQRFAHDAHLRKRLP